MGRGRRGETVEEFTASTANRFAIQAGDAGQFAVGGLLGVGREAAHLPAALRFVEPAEQQVDLLVALAQGRVGVSPTGATRALMDSPFRAWSHGSVSQLGESSIPSWGTCSFMSP